MLYGINEQGQKVPATPKTSTICPDCGGELMPKCGNIKVWHWAHKAHDLNCQSKPETEWHLKWKSYASPEFCEVPLISPHGAIVARADIMTKEGKAIELQHSSISSEEVFQRTIQYNLMANGIIWVFDVSEQVKSGNLSITSKNRDATSWKNGFARWDWKWKKQSIFTGLRDAILFFEERYQEKIQCNVYLDLGTGSFYRLYTKGILSKNGKAQSGKLGSEMAMKHFISTYCT